MLELTYFKIIQLALSYIMVFFFGLKFKIPDKARDRAGIIWFIIVLIMCILDTLS